MQPLLQPQSRKKFVKWGIGIVSSLTIFSLVGSAGSKKQVKKQSTIKMLGEDGQLVEVIQSTLPASRKKISDKELQNWIKK